MKSTRIYFTVCLAIYFIGISVFLLRHQSDIYQRIDVITQNMNTNQQQHDWIYNRDHGSVVRAAKTITDRPVMVSLINDAFLPFALHWLCHTGNMGVHKQVLLIATDENSRSKLNKLWPDVTVVVISVENSMMGPQRFSHAGYVRLCIRRTQILQTLIYNDIETFMFELDTLWIENAVPLLHSYIGKYDIVLNGVTSRNDTINGGFLYLFPTVTTLKVLTKLNNMLIQLENKIRNMPASGFVPVLENDQEYMSKLVTTNYAGLKSKILPLSEFADGLWYKLPKKDRDRQHPYLISFNWIAGNTNKMNRAKKWGHWFIKNDSSCDNEQIKKVQKQFLIKYDQT